MRFVFITLAAIAVSACEPPPCNGPFPDHTYADGEKAIHIPTGEQVRITSKWTIILGGGKCKNRQFGKYTIRFNDGAEISPVIWSDLKQSDK